ncbi:MAG: hypothetical protein H0V12_10915 [Chloroflexi bacterium]|nr:hypothetical protein [Chloroflexota bacterium]
MAALTLLGLVSRFGKVVPLQATAGSLIVVRIPVILPENLPAVAEAPIAGSTALAVTAFSNPSYGIVTGQLVSVVVRLGLGAGGG